MRIRKYRSRSFGGGDWDFPEIDFQLLNLLVGDTATGKTRLLNTIFNAGHFVASNAYKSGSWDMTFDVAGIRYRWLLETIGARSVPDRCQVRHS